MKIDFKGQKKLMARLQRATSKVLRDAEKGLIDAGQFLQGESMEIVPVQTGNLRESSFVRKVGPGHVVVGYTAGYAAYVHENPNAAHGQAFNVKHAERISRANERIARGGRRSPFFNRGPKQQYKFLEKPAREKRPEMLRLIAARIR